MHLGVRPSHLQSIANTKHSEGCHAIIQPSSSLLSSRVFSRPRITRTPSQLMRKNVLNFTPTLRALSDAGSSIAALVRRPTGTPSPSLLSPQQQAASSIIAIDMTQVVGKQVITRTTGRDLGFVSCMWVDPHRAEVVSMDLVDKQGLGSKRVANVHLSRLTQIGDVVLVHDEQVLLDQPLDGRMGFTVLAGTEVRTSSGELIGKVRDFSFSPLSGALHRVSYDDPGLPFLPRALMDTFSLGMPDVLSISPGAVVVVEDAKYHERRETCGILAGIPSLFKSIGAGSGSVVPLELAGPSVSRGQPDSGLPQAYSYEQWELDVRRWEQETGLTYEQYINGWGNPPATSDTYEQYNQEWGNSSAPSDTYEQYTYKQGHNTAPSDRRFALPMTGGLPISTASAGTGQQHSRQQYERPVDWQPQQESGWASLQLPQMERPSSLTRLATGEQRRSQLGQPSEILRRRPSPASSPRGGGDDTQDVRTQRRVAHGAAPVPQEQLSAWTASPASFSGRERGGGRQGPAGSRISDRWRPSNEALQVTELFAPGEGLPAQAGSAAAASAPLQEGLQALLGPAGPAGLGLDGSSQSRRRKGTWDNVEGAFVGAGQPLALKHPR